MEFGDCDSEVNGNRYEHCQTMLRKIYRDTKGNRTIFTLTPPIPYQKQQGWPNPPFVNINLHGSQSTTRENWLGYIPITYSDIDYLAIVMDNGPVDVYGEVKKEKGRDGLYYVCLNVSNTYCKYCGYVQHDKEQLASLKKIAKENDYKSIDVKAIKQNGSNEYSFLYKGKVVATASADKIDSWLDGSEILSSRLRTSYFRYDDAKPFSELEISKRFVL